MNNTTKYGLFFLGGVVVGALGAVAITRGKLNVKPLAADLLSTGLKEDLADVMAEAEVKSQERKLAKEALESAKSDETLSEPDSSKVVA